MAPYPIIQRVMNVDAEARQFAARKRRLAKERAEAARARALEPRALGRLTMWIAAHPADWSFFIQSMFRYTAQGDV